MLRDRLYYEIASVSKERAIEGLEHLRITIDRAKNQAPPDSIAAIWKDGASAKVLVVRTSEESEIARRTIHAVEKVK
jgi:acetate kinase